MFSKLAFVATFALLAVAIPTADQCNTGSLQCCTSVQSAGSDSVASVLSLLGVVVQDASTPVGIGCSPITLVGAGSTTCETNPVCCENTNYGSVAIGCVPVDASL